MPPLEQQLAQAISASFAKYNSHGPRSPEKLKPLHGFVASHLASIFGSAYKLHYLGNIDKELPVENFFREINNQRILHEARP